jgi:uncharacterized protein
MENAVIVFIKNPTLGKVKTRLAKTIGDEKALEIYKLLIKKTFEICQEANQPTFVFYADEIIENDLWQGKKIIKKLQNSNPDLGIRMHSAFQEVFALGFSNVLIIGSDIFEITSEFINRGFECLAKKDAIIGLAYDGGYYELGLTKQTLNSHPYILDTLFLKKTWSHDKVGSEALATLKAHKLAFEYLPKLRDIDTLEDLRYFPDLLQKIDLRNFL